MSYQSFSQWAQRWNIPQAALDELFSSMVHSTKDKPDASEAYVQSQVRLEAPSHQVFLFRNNCGAGKMESGNFVRYGLANDSEALSNVLKSGDLIGWRKRLVTAAMIGSYVAQFTSRECKRSAWKWRNTEEEQAQAKWAALVNRDGGDAKIITSTGSFA